MNKDLSKNDASTLETTDDLELEGESLTEICASESTLGGAGQYREAGVGRFL